VVSVEGYKMKNVVVEFGIDKLKMWVWIQTGSLKTFV
jgi:hypothetical protein